MHTLKAIKLKSVLLFLFVIGALSASAEGRSVYAITDRQSTLTAYHINGVEIDYQTTDSGLPDNGFGAVGLALDPSVNRPFLFVTFEGKKIIELVNASTMQYADTVTATGASNLAGIAYDQGKQKVYVVDRGKKYLYIYDWYPDTLTLVQDGDPCELEGLLNNPIGGASGPAATCLPCLPSVALAKEGATCGEQSRTKPSGSKGPPHSLIQN
ncbi:MAG: YncE family protein [Planctomycetota bacterium]|jgi:hypothetical protein